MEKKLYTLELNLSSTMAVGSSHSKLQKTQISAKKFMTSVFWNAKGLIFAQKRL